MKAIIDWLIGKPEILKRPRKKDGWLKNLEKRLVVTTKLIGEMAEESLLLRGLHKALNAHGKSPRILPWNELKRVVCQRESHTAV